ncbi:hypothetical protein EDD11_007545 [Mortierella claussenii]|nr:hypothetical protein EDD11_007545 [Mortierella claussenii]
MALKDSALYLIPRCVQESVPVMLATLIYEVQILHFLFFDRLTRPQSPHLSLDHVVAFIPWEIPRHSVTWVGILVAWVCGIAWFFSELTLDLVLIALGTSIEQGSTSSPSLASTGPTTTQHDPLVVQEDIQLHSPQKQRRRDIAETKRVFAEDSARIDVSQNENAPLSTAATYSVPQGFQLLVKKEKEEGEEKEEESTRIKEQAQVLEGTQHLEADKAKQSEEKDNARNVEEIRRLAGELAQCAAEEVRKAAEQSLTHKAVEEEERVAKEIRTEAQKRQAEEQRATGEKLQAEEECAVEGHRVAEERRAAEVAPCKEADEKSCEQECRAKDEEAEKTFDKEKRATEEQHCAKEEKQAEDERRDIYQAVRHMPVEGNLNAEKSPCWPAHDMNFNFDTRRGNRSNEEEAVSRNQPDPSESQFPEDQSSAATWTRRGRQHVPYIRRRAAQQSESLTSTPSNHLSDSLVLQDTSTSSPDNAVYIDIRRPIANDWVAGSTATQPRALSPPSVGPVTSPKLAAELFAQTTPTSGYASDQNSTTSVTEQTAEVSEKKKKKKSKKKKKKSGTKSVDPVISQED